ncbi:GILT-like protein 1 [Panulirus ornatus]|uniref:GILT-like protein 1 n=1 Tax=Panulirus ornatus TaxID=150431 RepID=UPI003A841372
MLPQLHHRCCLPLLLLLTLTAANPDAAKVKVTVYQESLCIDSRTFLLRQLYPLWTNLSDIIDLDFNSYGKSKEYVNGDDYSWTCQHGPEECLANVMLTCAKKYIEDECQLMDFNRCVMKKFTGTAAGPPCAIETGVEFQDIQTCYNSAEGRRLQHEVGVAQGALVPSLTDVPWILINDMFTEEQWDAAKKDLKKVVCDAYQGEKPDLC